MSNLELEIYSPPDYLAAKEAMRKVQGIGVLELRAVALSMLTWIDDDSLRLITSTLEYPRIRRGEFVQKIRAMEERNLAKVIVGVLMVDTFSNEARRNLMFRYKIGPQAKLELED